MSRVLYISLFAIAAAQLLYGSARIIVLALGLAGLFLPQLVLGLGQARWPRATWIYVLLLAACGAAQSISTGDLWPVLSATALAVALLLFLSIAPRITAGMTGKAGLPITVMFLGASAYASFDGAYIEAVRSSAPPLALAAMVMIGLAHGRKTVFLSGAVLFLVLALVWNSRAEALAVFAYLATYVYLHSQGGIRKSATVVLTVAVVVLLAVSEYWAAALKLDDAYRGVGSGLTGRVAAFEFSMDLISERPLLGVGYRHQEAYFEDAGFWVGQVEYPISSSHNGLLGILIEWGIVGSFLLLAPVLARAGILLRSVKESRALPVLVSFLAFIMFERYYINFGNLYSIIMIALTISWLRFGDEGSEVAEPRLLVRPS